MNEAAETEIATALDGKDLTGAATIAMRSYGPEILGFLVATLRDDGLAEDAFAEFAERMWIALPKYQRRCSMRTWSYLLARHAARDARRAKRRSRAEVPLRTSMIGQLAEQVRAATLPHLKSTSRDSFERMRDELDEDERMLLVLRVDRKLAWNDLARVFLEQDQVLEPDDATVTRESSRLRKRFQLLKEKLHEIARKRGLTAKL